VLRILIFRVPRADAEAQSYERVRSAAQIASRLSQHPQDPHEVAANAQALLAWIEAGADPDDIQRRFDAAWMQYLNRSKGPRRHHDRRGRLHQAGPGAVPPVRRSSLGR
jgi:hypothetical protein